MKETNKFTLNINKLIKAISNGSTIEIWENSKGSGRNSEHNYYYLNVNNTKFKEESGYSCYGFAKVVADQIKAMESELLKNNIHLKWAEQSFECGGRDIWGCPRTDTLMFPVKAKKITPCKEFGELQKWLEKKAECQISVFDIFRCSLCQKRSSKSLSDHHYIAISSDRCANALTALKAALKPRNTITTEIVTEDYFDGGYDHSRSECEQYGGRDQYLKVTIKTPSGRVGKELKIGMGYYG